MRFEWNPDKCNANVKKHGIDFGGAERLFAGYTVTIEDDRFSYDEARFITFGLLDGIVVAVAHTERADVIRIISMRKATRNETKHYFSTISAP